MGAKVGGGGKGRYDLGQNADINVTPFIDVMLVLLIIFMASIPVATVSIRLDMPPPSPPTTEKPPQPPVFISVQPNGDLFVTRGEGIPQRTTLDTLEGDLVRIFAVANPYDEQVLIQADKEVIYRQFMDVMNRLQETGFYKVGLISEDIS